MFYILLDAYETTCYHTWFLPYSFSPVIWQKNQFPPVFVYGCCWLMLTVRDRNLAGEIGQEYAKRQVSISSSRGSCKVWAECSCLCISCSSAVYWGICCTQFSYIFFGSALLANPSDPIYLALFPFGMFQMFDIISIHNFHEFRFIKLFTL